jgi:hypothetical protein
MPPLRKYTERIPSRHESSIDTVVALFSAAEMVRSRWLRAFFLPAILRLDPHSSNWTC